VPARQYLGVAGRRLLVRADPAGLPGRRLAVLDHGGVVARPDRVVQGPERIAVRAGEQGAQHVRVQLEPDAGRQRFGHRPAGELVPEGHHVTVQLHDAGPFGLRHRRQVADQHAKQVYLGAGRYDRQPVQSRLRGRAQRAHPGQHRVDDSRRHDVTRVGQYLADEERVAAGEPEQLGGIEVRRGGQVADRVRGERGQAQPGGRRAAEHAEHAAQRMVPGQGVVTVSQQQHGRQVLHPGAEETQYVEGRAVSPMGVLDDEHSRRRRRGQLVAHGREHQTRVGLRRQRRGQWSARGRPGRVSQRAERARREQVLARAGQDPRAARRRGQEGLHQAGLADAGLAEHQHGRPPPGTGTLHGRAEHLQLSLPLQQRRRHAHHSRTGPADR
jgi:hypothetical protein